MFSIALSAYQRMLTSERCISNHSLKHAFLKRLVTARRLVSRFAGSGGLAVTFLINSITIPVENK